MMKLPVTACIVIFMIPTPANGKMAFPLGHYWCRRAARALRPEGIKWPVNEDGRPSLRLDQLTIANGIAHESAHDALSDVYATIGMAKLVRQASQNFFSFLCSIAVKAKVLSYFSWAVLNLSCIYRVNIPRLKIALPLYTSLQHPTNTMVLSFMIYYWSWAHFTDFISRIDIQQRLSLLRMTCPKG